MSMIGFIKARKYNFKEIKASRQHEGPAHTNHSKKSCNFGEKKKGIIADEAVAGKGRNPDQ